MSPYREPPPVHNPAPKAPWHRVAWAVMFRGLRLRLRLRSIRRSYRYRLAAYEQMFYARDRLRALRRAANLPPSMPLPGPAKSVSM